MPITNFPPDLLIIANTSTAQANRPRFYSRLTTNGDTYLTSSSTIAETTETTLDNPRFTNNVSYATTASGIASGTYVGYAFKRAPGFMDVVCYTGTGNTIMNTVPHSLSTPPELVIVKGRNEANIGWLVLYSAAPYTLSLQATTASPAFGVVNKFGDYTNYKTPTATNFYVNDLINASGYNFIAYLFATLAGISKVGSYTGNGGTQTINCGFAAGARFILIKQTNAAGDWYVWDSARGIAAANDPHLSLNTNAAHVTTDDSIDPANSGFIAKQNATTNINVTSATYIFLAIA